ncbi:hypothetical protein BDY24DRAFT_378963 [Mrakia frigida]|uniref:uncharacterized protein n=1 Tax=Mrakia frigida TaxID=29902 RepID=UPI003FCC220B
MLRTSRNMLMGTIYGLSTFTAVAASALGEGRSQLSFQPPPNLSSSSSPSSHDLNVNTTANYIFNSLAGALAQLPNTIHPNGHLLLPVTIPTHTTVYHARNDNGSVPSPDWVAMDVEMSYGIMTGRSGGTWLSTFVTAREIKLVYFDGNSAALGTPGWLDTQDVVAPPEEDETPGHPGGGWNGEHDRAVRLCEWNEREKLRLDGFLRMNSGFEVMWCDFDSGALELVSHLNITPPDVPLSSGGSSWDHGGGGDHHFASPSSPRGSSEFDDALPPPPEGSYPGRRPGEGGGGPPGRGGASIFSSSSRFEWLRVSTHRYHIPQPHIVPDWSSFVTFYHPRLSSLVEARKGVSRMGDHQVKRDASEEDVSSVRDEIVEVLRRSSGSRGSGVDWSQLSKDVVERYGDRLANLDHILNGSSSSSSNFGASSSSLSSTNFTLLRTKLSVLTYTMLNPFLDTTHLSNTSSSSTPSSLWLPSTLDRCSTYLTRTVSRSTLTDQERILKASIDFVTGRICSEIGGMFEESLLGSKKGREEESLVKEWRGRVKELMSWLDWPIWTRCEVACSWNEVCAIPMWPLTSRGGPRGDPDPKTPPVVPYCLALDGEEGRF